MGLSMNRVYLLNRHTNIVANSYLKCNDFPFLGQPFYHFDSKMKLSSATFLMQLIVFINDLNASRSRHTPRPHGPAEQSKHPSIPAVGSCAIICAEQEQERVAIPYITSD